VNQFIVAAVTENVGVMETAREFLERRGRQQQGEGCRSRMRPHSGPCRRTGRRPAPLPVHMDAWRSQKFVSTVDARERAGERRLVRHG
jgi:hypothetical protein